MLEQIKQTAEWLKARMTSAPQAALVLGSGLGKLGEEIEVDSIFSYAEIPNFPVSTVEGHDGKLIVGRLGGKAVLAMKGRFHYYEGYTMQETTFPIRVFYELGIKTLFVSNAAGGTNPGFHIGDLMLITDHINMLPEHPLRGKNLPMGPRFPDMSNAYDYGLRTQALEIASRLGIKIQQGIYLANQGPTYETPAEYRMYRLLGADAVGMSTVPEVIVAAHQGMRCLGMSVITNIGQKAAKVTHQEVEEAANVAQPRMTAIFRELIKSL